MKLYTGRRLLPDALFAETAMAAAMLLFISGAMLLISQALTTGLTTKMPDTAMQTAA